MWMTGGGDPSQRNQRHNRMVTIHQQFAPRLTFCHAVSHCVTLRNSITLKNKPNFSQCHFSVLCTDISIGFRRRVDTRWWNKQGRFELLQHNPSPEEVWRVIILLAILPRNVFKDNSNCLFKFLKEHGTSGDSGCRSRQWKGQIISPSFMNKVDIPTSFSESL